MTLQPSVHPFQRCEIERSHLTFNLINLKLQTDPLLRSIPPYYFLVVSFNLSKKIQFSCFFIGRNCQLSQPKVLLQWTRKT